MGSDNEGSGGYWVTDLEDLEKDNEGTLSQNSPEEEVTDDDFAGESAKPKQTASGGKLQDLQDSINHLISIFEKAGDMIEEDDYSSKIDKILDQNKQIANGLIGLANRVKQLESKVNSSSSPKQENQERNPPQHAPNTQQSPTKEKREHHAPPPSKSAPSPSAPQPVNPPPSHPEEPPSPSEPPKKPATKPSKSGKEKDSRIPKPPEDKGFFSKFKK